MTQELPWCECRITRRLYGSTISGYCGRRAANNIVVIPSTDLQAGHQNYDHNGRPYRSVFYCTQHTRMLEAIYAKPWMDTWELKITNLRATRG